MYHYFFFVLIMNTLVAAAKLADMKGYDIRLKAVVICILYKIMSWDMDFGRDAFNITVGKGAPTKISGDRPRTGVRPGNPGEFGGLNHGHQQKIPSPWACHEKRQKTYTLPGYLTVWDNSLKPKFSLPFQF